MCNRTTAHPSLLLPISTRKRRSVEFEIAAKPPKGHNLPAAQVPGRQVGPAAFTFRATFGIFRDMAMGRLKKYLWVRFKKRWPVIPGATVMAGYGYARNQLEQVPKTGHRDLLFFTVFAIFVILFPFPWGSEDLSDDQWYRFK